MNEEEKQGFYECYLRLQRHKRRLRDFIEILYLNDIITPDGYMDIRQSMKKHLPINIAIIHAIPNGCRKERLLNCLKMNSKLYTRFKNKLYKKNSQPLVAPQSLPANGSNESYINNFYEMLKATALRSGRLEWNADFKRWANHLSSTLQTMPTGTEKRNVADCFFVLLDLQAVLQKRHEADKSQLWTRPVFQTMEGILCETSNPSLSRLIFQSRKGTACAQSHQFDEVLKYASLVLCDVAMFSCGKQIGSCIFAVVNMYLQYYSSLCQANKITEALEYKERILHWVEVGYNHFAHEERDIQLNWRRVYLDKKIYCHLGIDILSRDIAGAQITDNDIKAAKWCIFEMMELKDGMERLRLLHLFVACAKVNRLEGRQEVAKGYCKEALKHAEEGKFLSEVAVLKEHASSTTICPGIPMTTLLYQRTASEHDETSSYKPDETSKPLSPEPMEDQIQLESFWIEMLKKLHITKPNI
ncbi:uncharacterized protein LOC117325866 [Pecten maximus]|uniref:uncharacterized protein LOC117325866 n=1 Tax=Pecten maximus TaxID=6579 RepID=UPI0014590CBC|nr:uncharacterized protein LOC117325866 [Pecten maximus]